MSFPKQGPKDWSPLWLDQVMEGLEEFTVDTDLKFKNNDKLILGVADVMIDGKLSAYHVTDDPEVAERAIKRKDLESHPHDGSLCPGLYVSAFPREWRGRSRKKWDFLKELSEDRRIMLASILEDHLRHHRMAGYITQAEMERGIEWTKVWLETVNPDVLIELARQPYNINIPEVADRNGLAEPWKPFVVQVIFEGRYLQYNPEVQKALPALAAYHLKRPVKEVGMDDVCRTLIYYGWDGMFTNSNFAHNSDSLVIWNPEKILSYGLREGSPRLSGRLSGSGEGGTTQEGRRFMSSFSPNHKRATIQDVGVSSKLFGPMGKDAMVELKETLERLWQGLDPQPGRFRVDLSKELPEIVDSEVYRRIPKITREDLAELMFLVDEIVGEMAP